MKRNKEQKIKKGRRCPNPNRVSKDQRTIKINCDN